MSSSNLFSVENDAEEVDEPLPIPSVAAKGLRQPSSGIILPVADDGEEEADEPLPILADAAQGGAHQAVSGACSAECTEALAAISTDAWDISSWIVYIDEVTHGRRGTTTVVEAYNKMLTQFPRSATFWNAFAEFYTKSNNPSAAIELFEKCINKCRSVDLWMSYINLLITESKALNGNKVTEQYWNERKAVEQLFERAIEQVGMAIDNYTLWREYINIVKKRIESDMAEAGRKLTALRSLYQRAVQTPMDQIEEIWTEYENFEKEKYSTESEQVLQDINKKYLHAKSIYRERKRITNGIVFDRLATPPTTSTADLQQLELWNQWIRFEMGNPDNLSADAFKSMMQMAFEQCLCCFLYNAEIWLSYANFSKQYISADVANSVYKDAIEVNPTALFLRIGWAEAAEVNNNLVLAKEIYQVTFDQQPNGFTFQLLQRFIRRQSGILAARELFSSTFQLRNSDAKIGLEVYLAHAQLEFDVNRSPDVALKVLNSARNSNSHCLKSITYIRLITKILVALGDVNQLRWIYQTALGISQDTTTASLTSTDSTTAAPVATKSSKYKIPKTVSIAANSSSETLMLEMEITEEYLRAEMILGQCDIHRLNHLRELRDKAKTAFEDFERARLGIVNSKDKDDLKSSTNKGIYELPFEIAERYSLFTVTTLPEYDSELRDRSTNFYNKQSGRSTLASDFKYPQSSSSSTKEKDAALHMSADFHMSMSGLPVLLRDLLMKLPLYVGPPPDIDQFIRHMKSVILPPRPIAEEETSLSMGDDSAVTAAGGGGAPDWLKKSDNDDDVEDDMAAAIGRSSGKNAAAGDSKEDDIFRKRQRTRLV